jgi:hypothetical protein
MQNATVMVAFWGISCDVAVCFSISSGRFLLVVPGMGMRVEQAFVCRVYDGGERRR